MENKITNSEEKDSRLIASSLSGSIGGALVGSTLLGPIGATIGVAAGISPFIGSKVLESPFLMNNGISTIISEMLLGKGMAEKLNKYVEARKGDIESEPIAKSINKFFNIVDSGGNVLLKAIGAFGAIGYLGMDYSIKSRAMLEMQIDPLKIEKVNNNLQSVLEQ